MRDLRNGARRVLATMGGIALAAGAAIADPGPSPQDAAKAEDKAMTTKTGPVTWTFYGRVEASLAYNDSRMNSIRLPGVVLAESPAGGAIGHNQDRFAMWARNSRLGVKMDAEPIDVLLDAKPSAVLEFDFMGGGTGTAAFPLSESVTPLRIRKAYVRLEKPLADEMGELALQMGQDWEIISPLNPGVNTTSYNWGVGNSGGFRPHLRVEAGYRLSEQVKLKGAMSFGVTGPQDLADADGNGTADGEAAAVPNLQLCVGAELDLLGAHNPIKAGLWTHKQWQKTDAPVGGRTRFHGYGWGLFAEFSLMPIDGDAKRDKVTVRGEFYTGANLSDIRGGTQGGIFLGRTGPGSGKNVTETGYWLEGSFAINESLSVLAGLGAGDPENEGLPAGAVSVNRAFWVGLVYDVKPVSIGLELMRWETRYLNPGSPRHSTGTNNRFHLYLAYDF